MAFPAGPYTDGQIVTDNGLSYTYSAAAGAFRRTAPTAPTAGGFSVGTLANRPSAPTDGTTYFVTGDSTAANNDMFWEYDTVTSQWYSWKGFASASSSSSDLITGSLLLDTGTSVPKNILSSNLFGTIALGDGNICYYSTDGGLSFKTSQLPTSTVAYGQPGVFPATGTFAVGVADTNGTIATSTDGGANWTTQSIFGINAKITHVYAIDGKFVYATSPTGYYLGETNPTSISTIGGLGGKTINGLTGAGESLWGLVADNRMYSFWSSTNTGIYTIWVYGGSTTDSVMGFAYSNSKWVLARASGTILYTNAGPIGDATYGGNTGFTNAAYPFSGLVYSKPKGEFVAITSNGKMVKSPDGVTWTTVAAPTMGYAGSSYSVGSFSSIAWSTTLGKYLVAGKTATSNKPFIGYFS